MIGIIITGHGRFASGMKSALEVIAGECENVKTVDFEQGCSVQHFEEKMRESPHLFLSLVIYREV